MLSSLNYAYRQRSAAAPLLPQPRQAEAVYRVLTMAAMLLLLASLWLF